MWRPVPKVFCTSFLMENRFVQTLCNTESIMNKKSGNGSRWSVTVNVIFVTENAGWNAHRTRFSLSFHHYVSETVKCSEKQEDEYSHSKCQKFSIGHSFITGRFSPWLGFARGSAHVGFVVGRMAQGQVILRVRRFPLSVGSIISSWHSILISSGGWRIGPLVAAVQTHRLTPLAWTTWTKLV